MEKRTIFAFLGVALLGTLAFAVMRAPQKGQRIGAPVRPIPTFKAGDVAHLEMTNDKQEKVVVDKSGERWQVKQPGDWPADATAVKALLDGLDRLGFGDQVTEGTQRHEDLGVAEGKAA